ETQSGHRCLWMGVSPALQYLSPGATAPPGSRVSGSIASGSVRDPPAPRPAVPRPAKLAHEVDASLDGHGTRDSGRSACDPRGTRLAARPGRRAQRPLQFVRRHASGMVEVDVSASVGAGSVRCTTPLAGPDR